MSMRWCDLGPKHYRVYTYVTTKLFKPLVPLLLLDRFSDRHCGVHSMRGHGALFIALRKPEKFRVGLCVCPFLTQNLPSLLAGQGAGMPSITLAILFRSTRAYTRAVRRRNRHFGSKI
jgi:S-formylglutathione hydrolase FrmB